MVVIEKKKKAGNLTGNIAPITLGNYLMGRQKEYPVSADLLANATNLIARVNRILRMYGKSGVVSSGYRPGKYNQLAGGSVGSAHITCQAR